MIKQENHKIMDLYKSLVDKVIELNSLTETERLDLVSELNLGNFKSHYSDKFQKKKEFVIRNLPIASKLLRDNETSEILEVISKPRLTLVASLSDQFETFITVSRLTTMQCEDFVLIVFDEVKDDPMKILEAINPSDKMLFENSKILEYLDSKKSFDNSEEINDLFKLRMELAVKPFEKMTANDLFIYSNELYNKTISLIAKEFNVFFILEGLTSFYEFKLNKRTNFLRWFKFKPYDPLTIQFIIDAMSFRSMVLYYLKSRKNELSFKNKFLLNLELKRLKKNGYLNNYRFMSSTPICSGTGFLVMNINYSEYLILGIS